MAQDKYIIVRNEDAQRLTPIQQQQLMDILGTIAAARSAQGKSVNDLYFVLNMKDQYAFPAIDGYIGAIQNDAAAAGVVTTQNALAVAHRVRNTAAMTVTPRPPT